MAMPAEIPIEVLQELIALAKEVRVAREGDDEVGLLPARGCVLRRACRQSDRG